ncbi:hypothetical protein IJ670_03335 [bacterium]|nr:hypothetical protein [bacterium]
MRKIFILVFLVAFFNIPVQAGVISGQIHHDDMNYQNKIIDSKTKSGLSNAKITIPELNYTTYSDKDGIFKLNVGVNQKTVLFVEKDGYRTFSLTIDNNVLSAPLKLGIEQASPFDLQITHGIIHLGDNMFSSNSANSSDFKLTAQGHFFSKIFPMPKYSEKQNVVICIGTLIGLDTKKAKELGQNHIAKVYASPAEVFVNGNRISSLELNGDNIEITVPKSILKSTNELVIKAGKNLFQHNYVDYDDIELANVRVEVRNKTIFASKR